MLWKSEKSPHETQTGNVLYKVTPAFGVNLTLSKVQLEEHLPLFLGLREAESGFSKSQESCRRLKCSSAVSGNTAWRLLWSLLGACAQPLRAGAQPQLLEPGTRG